MLRVGKQKEQEFARFFRDVSAATTEQDMKEHWDLNVRYDVKMIRRKTRGGDFDENIHWVELKNVVESVHSICHSKIKSSVKSFVKNIPETLPKIYTEPYALEQILLNFLINAIQAADKDDSWIKVDVSVNNGERKHLCIDNDALNPRGHSERRILHITRFFTEDCP